MRTKDLDVQWLLETHFWGIDQLKRVDDRYVLVNPKDASDVMPESMIQREVDAAIARVEALISAQIKLKEHIVEFHDYDKEKAHQYLPVNPDYYPVIEVHSLELTYGENGPTIFEIPENMYQIKAGSMHGLVQVMPLFGAGAILGVDMSAGWFMTNFNQEMPSAIKIEYNAGLEGLNDQLDMDIVKVIGMLAAMHIFNIFGDILLGAGVANFSTSFDGLSISVGTTQSAENSAFSARVRQYEREVYGHSVSGTPGLIETLRKKYLRIPVGLL